MKLNKPTADSVWPVLQEIDPDFFSKVPECELFTLDNGIRVVLMRDSKDRSSYFHLTVNAGALHQGSQKRGIPHFTEHMLYQGTAEFPDSKSIVDHSEEYNIEYNGFVQDSDTGYYVECDNDMQSLEAAVKLLSQVTLHPIFPASRADKEREVILGERQTLMSDPSRYSYEVFNNHFFDQTHPLAGGGIIGSDDDIKSFTIAEASNYYHKYFHPRNMLLTVSGGKSRAVYERLINKYFNISFPGESKWNANPTLDIVRTTNQVETLVNRDFNHVNIYQGYYLPIPQEMGYPSKEYFALSIAVYALSLRSFLYIRDELGLTYSIGANMDFLYNGYFFNLSSELPAEKYAQGRIEQEKLLNSFLENPITESEFRRGIRKYRSVRWARGVRQIVSFAASMLFAYGQLVSPEAFFPFLDSLTLDETNAIVKRILQDKTLETIAVGKIGENK